MILLPEPWERPVQGASMQTRLRRLLVAIGCMLTLALAVAGVALGQVRSLGREVEETYFAAVVQGNATALGLGDANASLAAFVATCDDAALETYSSFRLVDPSTLAELRRVPEIGAAHARADAALQAWVRDYAERVVTAVRVLQRADAEGGEACADIAAQVGRSHAQGDYLFEEARGAVQDYLRTIEDQRARAVSLQGTWNQVLLGAVLVLVLVCPMMGILMWRALETWVVRPLHDLAEAVKQVSAGDVDREISPPVTTGEVAEVAAHVENMRRELVLHVEELRLSHKEIEAAHELLSAQARELERSNRDLEQFAYVASHDLQEPLRKVAMFTGMLRSRYEGRLDDRADLYIEYAVDGARRMQRLIQDLLSFARVGRSTVAPGEVDLETVLEHALRDLEERVTETGAVVTHEPLPVVHGQEPLLVQLFVNLLSNAIKFRHPDRPPRVHIEVQRWRRQWEVSFVDNGIGIEPRYAERVFVIFQRLHGRDDYPGTGIGLALVKRIVEAHSGRIWIEPTEGGGTTVRLTLQPAGGQVASGRASTERAPSTTLGSPA